MISVFSPRLRELIKANNLTQVEIADKLSTSQQMVSNWINGICEPKLEMLLRLCNILMCDPNYLLGFTQGE